MEQITEQNISDFFDKLKEMALSQFIKNKNLNIGNEIHTDTFTCEKIGETIYIQFGVCPEVKFKQCPESPEKQRNI